MPIYFMLFNEEGRLVDYQVITPDLSEAAIASYRERGYIERSINELFVYINPTSGEYGAGYLRDPETGEPVSAKPYESSKVEIADWLYDKTSQEIKSIENAMTLALINNDINMETLIEKRDALVEEYKEALEELAEEGEDANNGEGNNGSGNEGENEPSNNDNPEGEEIVANTTD